MKTGEYLGPRGMGSGEGSIARNVIDSIVLLIARVIKSRRLRWAGLVARMEDRSRPTSKF